MTENLITLFTKLTLEVVSNLELDEKQKHKKLQSVRQVAFDVIRSVRPTDLCDPCEEYGLTWEPSIVLTDYCYELARRDDRKASASLWSSVHELLQGEAPFCNEILLFLLSLKKDNATTLVRTKHPLSLTGKDYSPECWNPYELLPKDLLSTQPSYPTRSPSKAFPEADNLLVKFVEKKKAVSSSTEDSNKNSNNNAEEILSNEKPSVEQCPPKSPWTILSEDINNREDIFQLDICKRKKFSAKYSDQLMAKKESKRLQRKSSKPKNCNQLALSIYQSEKNVLHVIKGSMDNEKLRALSEDEYASHVLYLLRGIESETFQYDASKRIFTTVSGLCLENVPPDSLQDMSRDFLEAGTCFTLLQSTCLDALHHDVGMYGIVYHSFWKSVRNYLQWHSGEITTFPIGCSLISLHNNLRSLHVTITYLWKICSQRAQLPLGGALLTYLFDATCNAPDKQTQNVMLMLTSDCSAVFMNMVQMWIFRGGLDSLWRIDFFVFINFEMTQHRNRSYYRSIMTDDAKVPVFLKGLAYRILACGKAVHLLRLFNPENPFTLYLDAMKHPKIAICQTESEVNALQAKFEIYEREISDIITRSEVADQKTHKKMQTPISKKTELSERHKKHSEGADIKMRFEERPQKLAVQRVLEIEAENNVEERKREECQIVDEEMTEIKSQFNKLVEKAEHDKARAQWRISRFNKFVKGEKSLENDQSLDNEGNVVEFITADEENANVVNSTEVNKNQLTACFRSETSANNEDRNAIFNLRNREAMSALCTELMIESPDDNCNISHPLTELLRNIGCQGGNILKDVNSDGTEGIYEFTNNKSSNFGTVGSNIDTDLNADRTERMMEARNNKLKILGTEFGDSDITPVCINNTVDVERTEQMTEAKRNKLKMLGTEFGDSNMQPVGQCRPKAEVDIDKNERLTEARRNKLKILGTELDSDITPVSSNIAVVSDSDKTEQMTEARRNKLKILGTEFGDSNMQPVEEREAEMGMDQNERLTEARRNKLKILGTEFGDSKPQAVESFQPEKQLTQAMKNKLKILGSEYGTEEKFEIMKSKVPFHQMTEAMKNREKTLKTEYELQVAVAEGMEGEVGVDKEGLTPILTEAQKNKQKILEPTQVEVMERKPQQAMTEAMKNKMKVLGCEYGLTSDTNNTEKFSQPKGPLTPAQKNKHRMMNSAINWSKKGGTSAGQRSAGTSPTCGKLDKPVVKSKNILPMSPAPLDDLEPNVLFPSLPYIKMEKSKFDECSQFTPDMFEMNIQQCLDVAITIQERLVNVALFRHFLLEENYLSHVYSLKKYFLLFDGEFSRSLTQGLFESLARSSEPKHLFARNSLRTIVNEALNYHCSEQNELSLDFTHLGITLQLKFATSNAKFVSFQILEMPERLNELSHTVMTPFQLSYKVDWPLNIILTDVALSQYRKIFHLFLNLKRAHWALNETFALLKEHSKDKSIDGKRLMNSPHYTKIAVYRHAMTLYIMTLEEYICVNGPYEAWSMFIQQMGLARNLDDIYQVHVQYMKDILRRCFLVKATSDLLACIHELIEMSLKFRYSLKAVKWKSVNNLHYEHPLYHQLREIFYNFCHTTAFFLSTLKRRIQHPEMKTHIQLVELIDVKIKF